MKAGSQDNPKPDTVAPAGRVEPDTDGATDDPRTIEERATPQHAENLRPCRLILTAIADLVWVPEIRLLPIFTS